jgi:hypothetical protein
VVNRHPHHGNDWPYSRKVIRHMMGHVPVDERDKIVAANAVRTQQADPAARTPMAAGRALDSQVPSPGGR